MTSAWRRLAPISDPHLEAVCNGDLRSSGAGWALVVDADRTLARPDTGRLVGDALSVNERIRDVFATHGYSAVAFAHVSDIWSAVPIASYLAGSAAVAAQISLFRAWCEVFTAIRDTTPIIVATSGIPQVWRQVLARHGFADLPVLGGCHADVDEYLMNGDAKRRVVEVLQRRGLRVVAAGDSLIDEAMLRQADLRIIVPDHRGSAPLRQALAGEAEVHLLCPDEREFADFPAITSSVLTDRLLSRNSLC